MVKKSAKEMAYVSTIISGAASLGVLIGLISGIFFLVLTALKWVTRVRAGLYEEELKLQKRLLINNSYLVGGNVPDFLHTRKIENGFGSTLQTSEKPFVECFRKESDQNFQSPTESTSQCGEHKTNMNAEEKQDPDKDTIKVREMIEKMVESMIEGPLDGTTVGQLSTHSAYLEMFTKYHNLLCRELGRLGFALHLSVVRKNAVETNFTDLRQTSLKRLIRRIITEAMALPNIKDILRRPKASKPNLNEDFKNKSYEDILATAILNKVIENFQNKNQKENEMSDENPKPRLRNKKIRRTEDESAKSDGDWSDTSRSDQLSLTIEEYIEEVTTALEVSDDERSELSDFETTNNRRIPFPESGRTVVDAGTDDENSDPEEENTATELVTSTSSWEENWLFQKKRLRSTPNAHHPVPVPMLVPNPSEDFRALVGGVDADDLSDMSDCSDSVLEDLITIEEKSKQLTQAELESEIQNIEEESRKTSEEPQAEVKKELSLENQKKVFHEVKRKNVAAAVKAEESEDEEKKKCEEKVLEETVETLTSPTLPDGFSQKDREEFSIVEVSHQYESLSSHSPSERTSQSSTNSESKDFAVRCPLAEREKEKWSNPVSLAENPYSLESIEKREQRKKNEYFRIGTYAGESIDFPDDSSDEFSKKETLKLRFSRDYYINASKNPSGLSPTVKQQQSDEQEQDVNEKFVDGDAIVILQQFKQPKKFTDRNMEGDKKETTESQIMNKSEYSLPSVKELAKQFTKKDGEEIKHAKSQTKLESKNKIYCVITDSSEKQLEVDYSTVPVSEIIFNLQQAAESAPQDFCKDITYNFAEPSTLMEISRKVDSKVIVESPKKSFKNEGGRFNGKEVHSLTARSISREFREGLKNNSYQKIYPKHDRISSGCESDQEDIVYSKLNTSPTPTVDLKNMKKFWEEIISANANSTKHK